MVVAILLVAVLVQGSESRRTPGRRPGVSGTPPASFDAATFDPLVLDGIRRGAYPGAALVIGR